MSPNPLAVFPGRQRFRSRLRKSLRIAARENKRLGLVILSLNSYQSISQTVGPAVADRLVRCAARRFDSILRNRGEFEYWGGDEFAIVLVDVNDATDVGIAVKDIQDKLEHRMFSIHEFYLTSNAGIALYPADGADPETLMRNAGAALASAKTSGGRTRRFYTHDMNAHGLRTLNLENQLLRALRRREFTIHYQPLINTRTWQLSGAEALLRWEHPKLGLIPACDFVSLAEENGLIIPIGEWALRTACCQLKAWQASGLSNLHLAVNVSARPFREVDPSRTIFSILEQSSIDPGCLELELTENYVMADDPRILAALNGLKALGVKLSIDDFGTGFSSLNHLRYLPLNTIKIDKSFVWNASASSGDAAVISSIITLAHQLNLEVVAEGVETHEQLKFLTNLGCDCVQGYLFSKPLPPRQFESFISQRTYDPSSSSR